MADEALDERGEVGDQQRDGASEQDFLGSVDSHSQTRSAAGAEDAGSHDNGDGDRRDAPAPRHAYETCADDYRNDDAKKDGPVGGAEKIKKGEADGAADESVYDAGVEGEKSGAEFGFRDDDDGDQCPQRIGVIDASENKPHDDAADQNSNGVLQAGGLGRGWSGSPGNGGHKIFSCADAWWR